jgi:hypothetical protein
MQDTGPSEIRIELTSETNLHLLLVTSILRGEYDGFKQTHKLRIDFARFAVSITGLLTASVERPEELKLSYSPREDGGISLQFFQNLRLLRVPILSLDFKQEEEENVNNYVQRKFTALKVSLEEHGREFEGLLAKIERRNPSLARNVRQSVEQFVQEQSQRPYQSGAVQ